MLFLNFKTYDQTTGVNLINKLEEIVASCEENPALAEILVVAPSVAELGLARYLQPGLQLAAQTVVDLELGATTGKMPLPLVKKLDIEYILANHSESRLGIEATINLIKKAKEIGINVVACCETIEEAKELVGAEPLAIAYEPPELIGSGISVTTRPEAVAEFVEIFADSEVLPLVGAGVSTKEDVENSLKLGAKGVLLASAFAKAEDAKAKLLELAEPLL